MPIDPSPGAPAFVAGLGSTELPAFVYTGMGAQWWGMGAELYASEPVFRAAIDHCDALWLGASLSRYFAEGLDGTPMPDPADAQPAGLALQIALTELWRSRGVEPGAVVGHSFGEIAAAWAAGAISLEQALSIAYHSAEIDHLWLAFHASVGHVGALAPRIPLYSTVAGGDVTHAGYWWRNLRETTRFHAALRRMAQDGWTAFAEIGPQPALSPLVLETVPGSVAVASMRRGRPQPETFARAVEKLQALSAASPDRRCRSTRASSASGPTDATAPGRNAFQRASVAAG